MQGPGKPAGRVLLHRGGNFQEQSAAKLHLPHQVRGEEAVGDVGESNIGGLSTSFRHFSLFRSLSHCPRSCPPLCLTKEASSLGKEPSLPKPGDLLLKVKDCLLPRNSTRSSQASTDLSPLLQLLPSNLSKVAGPALLTAAVDSEGPTNRCQSNFQPPDHPHSLPSINFFSTSRVFLHTVNDLSTISG